MLIINSSPKFSQSNFILAIILFASLYAKSVFAKTIIYSAPVGIQGASDVKVLVDGKPLFVYNTPVNFNRNYSENPNLEMTPMAYFDFSGQVNLQVIFSGKKIDKVDIRPKSYGIASQIKLDTVQFLLSHPGQITLEINGDLHRAIHIFANPEEINPPKQGDANVQYFGPGIHRPGKIQVPTGGTVYIAGGAVVYGYIRAQNVKQVKILGRGIIDGGEYDRWRDVIYPIGLEYCQDCSMEGLIILNPAAWTLQVYQSQNINLQNIKIISARANSDGITIQSCQHVKVSNCFMRTWDDSFVIKDYEGNSKDITATDCVIWTDLAQSLEIGYETRGDSLTDINFKNIDVIHNLHKPVLSIHAGDQGIIRNVHYENIRVEDATNKLVELWIGQAVWNHGALRGKILDIYYKNIQVTGGPFADSYMSGFDGAHNIDNINFEGLNILGQDILNANAGKFNLASFVTNVHFTKATVGLSPLFHKNQKNDLRLKMHGHQWVVSSPDLNNEWTDLKGLWKKQ